MDPTARRALIALGSIIALCGAMLLWAVHSGATSIQFIERHLGFSPDGGDGSFELILIMAILMIVTTVTLRWAFK